MNTRCWLGGIALLLGSWALAGCRQEEEPPPGPAASDVVPAEGVLPPGELARGSLQTAGLPEQEPGGEGDQGETEEKQPVVAEVLLTEAARQSCRVFVGDALPDAQLPDASGTSHKLSDLLGPGPAVVLFWRVSDEPFADLKAVGILSDLQNDVQLPYGDQGVRVVAVNTGNPPEVVRQCAGEAAVTFPVLADQDGTYFSQVATGPLPRIYLLDGHGKIIWLDLEFSATTRRQLDEAIQATLAATSAAAETGVGHSPGDAP